MKHEKGVGIGSTYTNDEISYMAEPEYFMKCEFCLATVPYIQPHTCIVPYWWNGEYAMPDAYVNNDNVLWQ